MATELTSLMRRREFAYADVYVHPPFDGPAFGPNGNIKPDVPHEIARYCKNESNCTVCLPDGTWLTTWSQGSYEHAPDERIVFSLSRDRGRSWTEPQAIVSSTPELRRAYAVPFIATGQSRIYLFFFAGNQAVPLEDPVYDSGNFYFTYSDDLGETWAEERRIDVNGKDRDIFPRRVHGCLNHPPQILPQGDVVLPVSLFQRTGLLRRAWMLNPGEVALIRCANILEETDADKLEFELLPDGPYGIRADVYAERDNPALNRLIDHFGGLGYESGFNFQEMTVVPISGGRWLGVGRTFLGSPGFTISSDRGRTWTPVERLRYRPDGEYIPHPMTMCPISRLNDGRFILMFTNNDGTQRGAQHVWDGNGRTRNPQWFAVGREIPGETRNGGIAFGEPVLLAEVDDSGEANLKTGISMPHFFQSDGRSFVMYNVNKEHMVLDEIPAEVLDTATP